MFLRGHMQNAYVTHDIDKAVEMMQDRFRLGRVDRFEPDMVVNTPHGHKPMQLRVASYWEGGLNFEFIQPVSGYVDDYCALLPADKKDFRPRFHHISLRRDDEAEMRAEIERLGLKPAFEGPVSIKSAIPSLIFIYLDGRETLGHYVEYTWKSDEAWEFVGWPAGRVAM